MKKISILSLTLIGALYISNADALKVNSGVFSCLSQAECANKLTYACTKLDGRIKGRVSYSLSSHNLSGKSCYNCSANCVAGGAVYALYEESEPTSSDSKTSEINQNLEK